MSVTRPESFSVGTYNFNNRTLNIPPDGYGEQSLAAAETICMHKTLDSDVYCLQGINNLFSELFIKEMAALGYQGHFEKFTGRNDDGIATFYRKDKFQLVKYVPLDFNDGSGRKGSFVHLLSKLGSEVCIGNFFLEKAPFLNGSEKQLGKMAGNIASVQKCGVLCGSLYDDLKTKNEKLSESLNAEQIPSSSSNETNQTYVHKIWHNKKITLIDNPSSYISTQPAKATFNLISSDSPSTAPSFPQLTHSTPTNSVNPLPMMHFSALSPVPQPSIKTHIEISERDVPPGKKLFISGTGPLGNWDKLIPMEFTEAHTWIFLDEGKVAPLTFEYKLRLDDGSWEMGENRIAQAGKGVYITNPPKFS